MDKLAMSLSFTFNSGIIVSSLHALGIHSVVPILQGFIHGWALASTQQARIMPTQRKETTIHEIEPLLSKINDRRA
jgi:hypothetical protein